MFHMFDLIMWILSFLQLVMSLFYFDTTFFSPFPDDGYAFGSPGATGSSSDNNKLSDRSTGSVGNGSLPLIIAVPACVAIVVVAIAIFILKKRRTCNNTAKTHRNTRFNAVPTQERENFKNAPPHNNTQLVPPKAPPSSGHRSAEKVSKNHSIDYYSDISSASRYHHPQGHSNQQYGY